MPLILTQLYFLDSYDTIETDWSVISFDLLTPIREMGKDTAVHFILGMFTTVKLLLIANLSTAVKKN